MIFASDLDRTLLFSKKNFAACAANEDVVYIDVKPNGDAISFIRQDVLASLASLSKQLDFIPVTAREVHQLGNVRFAEHGVHFTYAVCGNGSTVVKDGVIDPFWAARVAAIKENIDHHRLAERVTTAFPDVTVRERSFGYEIFAKDITEALQTIADTLTGLRAEEDHRRSYLMYEGIDKLSALQYVQNQLADAFLIASGDSIMDLPMIEAADVGIVCTTGELGQQDPATFGDVTLTTSSTSEASKEVISTVTRHL